MEKTKIDNIWLSLEIDNSSHSGLLYKRYSAEVLPDVFIALKAPEKLRCIAFRISISFAFDENQLNKLKDIKIETLSDEQDKSKKFLLILLLNKQHNRSNDGGNVRRTTEIFQLATSVLFQTPIQHFGITPNNLQEYPNYVIDFMKEVPTLWDETLHIDGYPGKYVVIARRHANQWYIAAINAEKEVKKIEISLPMLAGKNVSLYTDKKDRLPQLNSMKIKEDGKITLSIESGGGVIITNK